MGCSTLELSGHWVELGLSVEMKISGRALADWYYMGLGCFWLSNVLDSALPLRRLRSDTRLEHQDPASHMAQKKRKREKKRQSKNQKTNRQNPGQMVKANLYRQNHTKKHTHTHRISLPEQNQSLSYTRFWLAWGFKHWRTFRSGSV